VGLKRGPLSLVSTTEELLDRKVAVPVYKIENTAVGIRHADHVAHSIRKKLAINLPTSGGRSVGIVRSRTQTMEFFCFLVFGYVCKCRFGPRLIRCLHCDLQGLLRFPFRCVSLSILHYERSAGLCLWRRHGSRLVSRGNDT
jgi:hypothetical protein